MPAITEKQLQRLCRTWQRRLLLTQWNVRASFAPTEKMGDEEGHIDYEDEFFWAVVRVLDAQSAEAIEKTLVHELLHLRLAAWEVPYGHPPQETAINLLADALYAAYHKGRKGTNGREQQLDGGKGGSDIDRGERNRPSDEG